MSIGCAAGVLAGSVALMVAVMLLVRARFAPEGGHFRDSDRASGVFGFAGAGFAILLGFVVLLSYGRYADAKSHAADEATAVFEQYEVAALFQPQAKRLVLAAVSCVAFVLLYADPAERAIGQAVCVGSVTAVIVSSLLAVALLSSPIRGGHGSVGPTDMRYTLALVEAEAAALHDPLATPCEARGAPT